MQRTPPGGGMWVRCPPSPAALMSWEVYRAEQGGFKTGHFRPVRDNRSEAPQRAPKSRWDREDKQDDNFSACLLSVLFNPLQLDKILRAQKIPDYTTSLELLATGYKKPVGAKNGVTQIWRRTGAH